MTFTVVIRANQFGISPFQSERRLNLRTISEKTKARLLRIADEQHGWQLKKRIEEVARVKTQNQNKVERLALQKSTLVAEVKAGKQAHVQGMRAVQIEHREHAAALMKEIKAGKKLAKNDMHEEKLRQKAEVAKLAVQKQRMLNQAQKQRSEHKDTVCALTANQTALELLCSVSEVEKKKLERKFAEQQRAGATLEAKTAALYERLKSQDIELGLVKQERDKAQEEYNRVSTELAQVRSQWATTQKDLQELNGRFTKWKEFDVERRRKTKATINGLRKERDALSTVITCFHNVICVLTF